MEQPSRPGFKVLFYEPGGGVSGVYSSNGGRSPVVNIRFDLGLLGPGSMELELAWYPEFEVYPFQKLSLIHISEPTRPY